MQEMYNILGTVKYVPICIRYIYFTSNINLLKNKLNSKCKTFQTKYIQYKIGN